MLPDRVSNPGPLTYESGALPIALRGPAHKRRPSFFEKAILVFRLRFQNETVLSSAPMLPIQVVKLVTYASCHLAHNIR